MSMFFRTWAHYAMGILAFIMLLNIKFHIQKLLLDLLEFHLFLLSFTLQ